MKKSPSDIPATRADIDEMIELMRGFMDQTSFELKEVKNEIHEVKTEISDIKASLNHLVGTVDAIIGRIDSHETEMAARDAQFRRLLAWAQKVSKQTGIPLEGF